MQKQRFVHTLPPYEDEPPISEFENLCIAPSQCSFQEQFWPQMLPVDVESLIPYYTYQYPFLPIPSETFHSLTSLVNTTYPIDAYESLSYIGDGTAFENYTLDVPPSVSEAAIGDGLLKTEAFEPNQDRGQMTCIPAEIASPHPMVTSYGAVTILLRHLIRVDVFPDRSIYVSNFPADSIAATNGTGDRSCVIHPNGRVLHEGPDIHMVTLDRRAKISKRGIVFTSGMHCLSYLVDASGTKTTAEKFKDLSQDFSPQAFFGSSNTPNDDKCFQMVEDATHKTYRNGDEVWLLGGFRVKQDQWGDVKVSRNYESRVVKASPTNGQVSVKTGSLDISVSRYPNNYFSVHRGNQHVMASLRGFTVQNGTQKAGFNEAGRVVLK